MAGRKNIKGKTIENLLIETAALALGFSSM